MGKHRVTVFTRKRNRASRYIVRPSWLSEQPSWPCRKFIGTLVAFLAILAAVGFSGQVQVAPVDPPTVQAAFVAPAVMGGCHR